MSKFVVPAKLLGSAEELLDALAATDTKWPTSPSDWVFRGHGDSEWELLPSAHRKDGWESVGVLLDPARTPPADVGKAEKAIYTMFRVACDRCGLPMPDYGWRAAASVWPHGEDRRPLTLAQHHGIPTRYLDWTRRARHAAYFAGISALQRPPTSGMMDVWALRVATIDDAAERTTSDLRSLVRDWVVELVTTPAATNAMLHAQEGLFTLSKWDHRVPLDALLLQVQSMTGLFGHAELFRRFRLPSSEAKPLLQRLFYEGVDRSSLFPSFEGAARSVVERIKRDGLDINRVYKR